ncbi:MAG: hypothetical protein IOD05_08180 [Rhodobacter sp.]|jgi:altronate dehydratase|nr:hypothetical protein [Rhodobacter sp.]MCA3457554.1 hypothetical protein [Rhodobacter sp.]MCA3460835.1 hypothetical protein [Rhodobacter sp.]MCA3464638.1 hypothetical protein [Rhodobacter sp.]MCA3466936.1 hypothetical protein [Rhodobacter sp.]
MQARRNNGVASFTGVATFRGKMRKRGLSTLDLAGFALAALTMAVLAGLVFFTPERGDQPGSSVASSVVFFAGSGTMYKRAQADAKTYVDMLNTAGPMAQAMDGVGGLPSPVAAGGVSQLFNLQAGQP